MLNYKGVLVTFEGMDGSGKTTAMEGAAEILNKKYKNKIVTMRDPGTTIVSEMIRNVLLNPGVKMNSWTEYYLYVAARSGLIDEIKPKIKKGKIIFLDRFYDSTIAFQSFRNKIPLKVILEDNKRILQGIEPNLTLLYKVNAEIGMSRNLSNGKGNRIDRECLELHKKVCEGYKWIAETYKDRVRVVDASRTKKQVLEESVRIIDEFLVNVLNPD